MRSKPTAAPTRTACDCGSCERRPRVRWRALFTLAPHVAGERFLLLTVDALFAPAVLAGFLADAARHEECDGALAVTDFVDDEKPLRVAADERGEIVALGPAAGASPLVTSGFYTFHPRIFGEIDAARRNEFTALRQFLGHLLAHDYRLAAVPVSKTVDVDRPEDIAEAERFVRGGYAG